jgi:hypothetical protein
MTATVFRPAAGVAIKTVETALRNHLGGRFIPRRLGMRFQGMTESFNPMWVKSTQSPAGPTPSRWSGPTRPNRTRREDHAPLIVSMSSGRLILDRVARQHCPSPLHRHAQINTHSQNAPSKPDISTLRRIGHFYFALTHEAGEIVSQHRHISGLSDHMVKGFRAIPTIHFYSV